MTPYFPLLAFAYLSIYFIDLTGLSLEQCMDACLMDDACLSFVHDRRLDEAHNCRLLPFNRSNNQSLPVIETAPIDYFELACDRNAILKSMKPLPAASSSNQNETFKSLEPATVFPEIVHREGILRGSEEVDLAESIDLVAAVGASNTYMKGGFMC